MTSKKESVSISSDGYVDSTVMASKSIPLEKKETFWFFFVWVCFCSIFSFCSPVLISFRSIGGKKPSVTPYESQELQVGRPSFLAAVLIGGGALRRHIYSLSLWNPQLFTIIFIFFFVVSSTHAKIHFHSLLYGARATTTAVYTTFLSATKCPGMLSRLFFSFPSDDDIVESLLPDVRGWNLLGENCFSSSV